MAAKAKPAKSKSRSNPIWPFSAFRKTTITHLRGRRAGVKESSTSRFKGHAIYRRSDGGFTVPSLDRESIFDTKRDAQRFITAVKDNPGILKKVRQAYRKIANPGRGAFMRCVRSVTAGGSAYDPKAVCAAQGRRKYGAKKFAAMAAAGRRAARRGNPAKKAKRNPVEAAAERYQFFHGREPEEIIEVTEKIREHGVLSGIGKLTSLLIAPIDGTAPVELSGFRGALLAQNEKGTQLFIKGGDQRVELSAFGIRQPHEIETLGAAVEVVYETTKDHLAAKDGGHGNYRHPFGKHGTRLPLIIYDVRNKLLQFSGGGYDLPEVGIRG